MSMLIGSHTRCLYRHAFPACDSGACSSPFFGLVYVLDFVRTGPARRAISGGSGVGPRRYGAGWALYRTPSVTEQVLPFAILFGAMAAFLQLSRKLELVVASAPRASPRGNSCNPASFVATLIGLFSVLAFNPLAATLKQQASEIENALFAGQPGSHGGGMASGSGNAIRMGTAIIRAASIADGSTEVVGVTVFQFRQGWAFFRIGSKQRAAYLREGFWEFRDARIVRTGGRAGAILGPISSLRASIRPRCGVASPLRNPFRSGRCGRSPSRRERAGLDATPYRLRYETLVARPVLFRSDGSGRSFRFFKILQVWWGGALGSGWHRGGVSALRVHGTDGRSGGLLVSWERTLAAWFPAVVGSLLGVLALALSGGWLMILQAGRRQGAGMKRVSAAIAGTGARDSVEYGYSNAPGAGSGNPCRFHGR